MAAVAVAALRTGCRRSLSLLGAEAPQRTINAARGLHSERERVKPRAYEKFENPPEWRHVEALLFRRTVPPPKPKVEYPSGWLPPNPELAAGLPYYVMRTRNHMVPVYLNIGQYGIRRFTVVKKVHGDLAQFEKDLQAFLLNKYKGKTNMVVPIRRHEINCFVEILGDYVLGAREFVLSKGF